MIQEAIAARNEDPEVTYIAAKRFVDEYRRERSMPPLVEAGERLMLGGSDAVVVGEEGAGSAEGSEAGVVSGVPGGGAL